MRSSTRIGALAMAAGTMLALALAAAPAQAAGPNDLEISLDGGTTWATTATGQLFDGVDLVVPGDSVDDQLLLRNVGDTAGVLRITLRSVTFSDPAFASVLTVRVDTPGFTGSPVPLTAATPCAVLNSGQLLGPGQQVLVTAHAELGSLSGSDGQGATADFTIRAALHEVGAVPVAPTFCDVQGADVTNEPPDGQVAFTGAEIPIPLVTGAAALIGVGLFFLVAARRRRAESGNERREH